MKLYLSHDLIKAGGGQSSGATRNTTTEEQSTREYNSSYARRYEGVASGEAMDPDDPDVGGKWPDSDTVSDEVNSELENAEESEDDEKEDSTKKALECLQEFNKSLSWEVKKLQPADVEVEFLLCKGYTMEQINEGRVAITGRLRDLFNAWLCDRLVKSVDDILPRR